MIFVNKTNQVEVTARLWAHAHFGSKFIRRGATRIEATVSGNTENALNVTAFANTDGTTAVQVINNGNCTETVTLDGCLEPSYKGTVQTYLTNNANNLTEGVAKVSGYSAVAEVPAKSLLSFVFS